MSFGPLELSLEKEIIPDLNYTGAHCTIKNKENFTAVCLYNSTAVNKQDFLDQSE